MIICYDSSESLKLKSHKFCYMEKGDKFILNIKSIIKRRP